MIWLGWVFGLAVKQPIWMPLAHIGVLGFEPWHQLPILIMQTLGGRDGGSNNWGPATLVRDQLWLLGAFGEGISRWKLCV